MTSVNYAENERQIDEFLARKSRFVSSKEFEGAGKVLIFNTSKINPNAKGKFGPVIEYVVIEPTSKIERVVNASAITLITGLRARLREKPQGTDISLLIKKAGVGTDTKYMVEHATSTN